MQPQVKNADADIKVLYILSYVYLPLEQWVVSVKTNYVCGISEFCVVKMKSSILWDVMQRRLVISGKPIGPICSGSNITRILFLYCWNLDR
jgi:hypothetical protein